MFSICTAHVPEGRLKDGLAMLAASESAFTAEIGVLSRRFLQCTIQPHIIWANTEWVSEKHHNDAAQSLMKDRRDDRFSSIRARARGPYFEIFCGEEEHLRAGDYSDELGFIVVAHGLIAAKSKEAFHELREQRISEWKDRLPLLRIHHNIYAPDEFVAFLGFPSEEALSEMRQVGDLLLEEYLFTGLQDPMGMSCLAAYNQFICTPLVLPEAGPADSA
ncbi:hypothetical protein ACFLSZ_02185 [Candidatus Bipolaricaulota bacterium]